MAHSHSQDAHSGGTYNRAFAIGALVNILYVLAEASWGFWAGSLALLADAGHNLIDVLSLLLAWGASVLGARASTERRTYGLRRLTILAALVSGIALLTSMGLIAWEAVGRFHDPPAVPATVILVVAAIGVVVNAGTAFLFHAGKDHDLNVKGAYLHLAADAAVSLGVVLGAAGILASGWLWLDPAISLGIVAVIAFGTWGLLRDSLDLAVDAVPRHIDPVAVRDFLGNRPGVAGVHDLHIWGMSTTEAALTAHLVIPEPPSTDNFLERLSLELRQHFGIDHSTIQIERGDGEGDCAMVTEPCCRR